jgi:hypothetical protein
MGEEIVKDIDGNIIGCPSCGSRTIYKSGFLYRAKSKKQQWRCRACNRRTVAPMIIEKANFITQEMEPEFMPIDDLIEHRKLKYSIQVRAKESRKLINIDIKTDGVIGICHFGDPHIDDDGTNIAEIYSLCNLINKTDGMFAGNLGDIQNNWIGRLSFLYGQQSTSAKESWRLTEHFVNSVEWLYLIAGNHDVWSGDGDPLDFIMRDHKGVYEKWGARLNLRFPNKKQIRINARHYFKGHSMWNTAHGVSKAAQMGWKDHILTCGHTHISGYQVLKDPASGLISHAIQVASFKIMDNYADKLGLDDKNIFNAPVTIIDPKYHDDDNRLITTIFNPYEAADYLTWKRLQK